MRIKKDIITYAVLNLSHHHLSHYKLSQVPAQKNVKKGTIKVAASINKPQSHIPSNCQHRSFYGFIKQPYNLPTYTLSVHPSSTSDLKGEEKKT